METREDAANTRLAHTPGPWTYHEYDDGGFYICGGDNDVAVVDRECRNVEQEADARLIAAAPDLLAAAQRAAVRVAWLVEVALDCGAVFTEEEGDSIASVKSDLRAAIAKAEGGQE